MKKFILIVLGLVLLFFIGAATYVSMIDWNVHKNEIASRIENLTGKKVVFEGPLSMSLLPSPYLSASNVKVYNKEGTYSKKPLAEIKNMVAKLSLGSVMSGDFDVERMALSEPEINFELYAEGGLNWESDFTPEQEGNVRQLDISLDSVTLEKAKIHLVSKKNGIDATFISLPRWYSRQLSLLFSPEQYPIWISIPPYTLFFKTVYTSREENSLHQGHRPFHPPDTEKWTQEYLKAHRYQGFQ